VIISCQPCNC